MSIHTNLWKSWIITLLLLIIILKSCVDCLHFKEMQACMCTWQLRPSRIMTTSLLIVILRLHVNRDASTKFKDQSLYKWGKNNVILESKWKDFLKFSKRLPKLDQFLCFCGNTSVQITASFILSIDSRSYITYKWAINFNHVT